MDKEYQLKVQALLDGELPEDQARQVESAIREDPEAQALFDSLKLSRSCLVGFEEGIRLPESREFFWSKIERQLSVNDLVEARSARAPRPFHRFWRWLMPASAVAAVAAFAWIVGNQSGIVGSGSGPELESALADTGAFTYRDFSARTTLVWLSYPAEK